MTVTFWGVHEFGGAEVQVFLLGQSLSGLHYCRVSLCRRVRGGGWNSLQPLKPPVTSDPLFYLPLVFSLAALVCTGLNGHYSGKKSKTSAEAVSTAALEVLKYLESAMGKLSDDDEFESYFDDLVLKFGPKLFRERDVRIGFFVFDGQEPIDGSAPSATLLVLRKRKAFEMKNSLPVKYAADHADDGVRDHAKEMILRSVAGKDLWVKNVYKKSLSWVPFEKGQSKSYECFVSAPVYDSKQQRSLGLLTVDAPKVGDLCEADRQWVRLLAGMLSLGLRDEVAEVPKPKNPLPPRFALASV